MRPLDHALVAVGYGTTPEGQDFWILKNSWGLHWGDRGYMYVPRNTGGKGACGLAGAPGYAVRSRVTYSVVESVQIKVSGSWAAHIVL